MQTLESITLQSMESFRPTDDPLWRWYDDERWHDDEYDFEQSSDPESSSESDTE